VRGAVAADEHLGRAEQPFADDREQGAERDGSEDDEQDLHDVVAPLFLLLKRCASAPREREQPADHGKRGGQRCLRGGR